jgi:hypothetical protein
MAISISIISYANHLKISCNFHEQEQEQELPSTAGMVHSQHCMQEQVLPSTAEMVHSQHCMQEQVLPSTAEMVIVNTAYRSRSRKAS